MQVNILAFGIAKDIFGAPAITIEVIQNSDIKSLKTVLEERYPRLKQLASYLLAVNNNYAQDSQVLNATDEIAIIPPVSGG